MSFNSMPSNILIFQILLLADHLLPVLSLPTSLTLDVLYNKVQNLTKKYPMISSLVEIGRSFENRSIYVVKIEKGSVQNSSVVVEFGIHARELASVASGLFFIEKLLTNSACGGLLERIRWYIIPVLNPDGYKYAVERGRLWRKNRVPIPQSSCAGIDLNRNFPVGWENKTGSPYYCKETYCGEQPLSEPESMALKRFLDELNNSLSLDAYVSVHTCAPGIFYPYGYKREKANNFVDLERVGKLMQSSIKKVAGTVYRVAPAFVIGLGGGGVDEWVYDTYRVPLVYTLELDKDEISYQCFFVSAKATRRLTHECFAGLEALGEYLSPNALTEEERTTCYSYNDGASSISMVHILLEQTVLSLFLCYKSISSFQ